MDVHKSITRWVRVAALVALVAVTSCARGTEAPAGEQKRPVIGVTLLSQTHTFYKELEDALRAEANARGLDLQVVACEMDPAKQAAQIEDFVAQRVSALLVAPCDSSAIVPHVASAQKAGIPVFSVDIAVRGGSGVVSHIASDNTQGGRLAAQTLAQLLNGRGKVLIIDHPEVASVQDRTRGFDEEIKKHPGITVVGRPAATGQRARAMAVMEDMLQTHRDLNGVFAINDDTALGAVAVLKAANRQDIAVVGFDATAEAQDAIRAGGPLKADIAQYPARMGKIAIEIIAKHLNGETVAKVVPVEVGVVSPATLAKQ